MNCNTHKGQANYAPKLIATTTNAGDGFEAGDLAAAMKRLIKADKVESIEEGPPSRRRSKLVIREPEKLPF